jgi:hypothetical protein
MREHGVYLAATRKLSAANKARVKKARTKSVAAAIRLAKQLGKPKPARKRTTRVKKAAPKRASAAS